MLAHRKTGKLKYTLGSLPPLLLSPSAASLPKRTTPERKPLDKRDDDRTLL